MLNIEFSDSVCNDVNLFIIFLFSAAGRILRIFRFSRALNNIRGLHTGFSLNTTHMVQSKHFKAHLG